MNTNMPSKEASTVKKKKRLNFFDFLIILLVILLIGFVIFWTSPLSQEFKNRFETTVDLQYTVEVKNIDKSFLNKIQEGNIVVDSVSKSEIGTVIAVEIQEYETLSVGEDGLGIMVHTPDRYNVIITVSSDAYYQSGSGYTIGSCRIAVGENMALRFPDFVCEGYCIGLVTE